MRQARAKGGTTLNKTWSTRGVGTFNWPPAGTATWPLTHASLSSSSIES